ncbi:MAG: hypothetical protein AB1633_10585 [Elusimicrobiota bacterium]
MEKNYSESAAYFITLKTTGNCRYFDEEIICELFIENLNYAKEHMDFLLLAYKINPDNVEIFLIPAGKYNCSQIVERLKFNFEYSCNIMINNDNTAMATEDNLLKYFNSLIFNFKTIKNKFQKKYGNTNTFPEFKWKHSVYNRITRKQNEFIMVMERIQREWPEKNKGIKTPWYWIAPYEEK